MARPADARPARGRRRLVGAIAAVLTGGAVLAVGAVAGGGLGATGGGSPPGSVPASSSDRPGPSAFGPSLPPASEQTPSSPTPSGSPPPSGSPSGPSTAERRALALAARLRVELDRARRQLGIPGVSATILFPDGTSWTGTSGFADVAANVPVTPDTAFAVASVSKTFTSALVLQLVDEGRLRLTDRVAPLLPGLRLKIDPRITVAMLLNHTSGLADFFLNPAIDRPLQKAPATSWTTERALRYVRKPLSPPGRAFHYSNTNYVLLGLIAERVTGRPYGELVRARLLDPVGLKATWVQVAEPGSLPLAHGYRLPGTRRDVTPVDLADGTGVAPFRSVVTAAGAAGSIAATSSDLARWARALYGGDVLGPTGTATLLGGFHPATNYAPGVIYGYGVQVLSIDGHPSLGHSGRLLGFRSAMRHFPIDGLTIAVLTNQSRADPGVIVRRLLAIALPNAPACPSCPIAR